MKHVFTYLLIASIGFNLSSCHDSSPSPEPFPSQNQNGHPNQNIPVQPGVLTAAEWSDLGNWTFWTKVFDYYYYYGSSWRMYPDDRVSFLITDSTSNKTPIANALIEVKYQGTTEWKCKTDNKGKAEYIIDIFRENHNSAVGSYQFFINGIQYGSIKEFKDGINEITLNQIANPTQEVDIAFLVDATGSMADEINFLKADLADILNKAQQQQTGVSLRTAFCMYRDIGDEYVTRSSDFTTTTQTSIDFIKAQEAKGGGDYPEALDSALSYTLNQLSWNSNAKARVLFVLLDAPPENNIEEVIIMQECLKKAAEKGVKIIPIAASGTDKSTEFLMRFLAIGTGGSYVFLTDDSGVGNSHEEPSIGNYQTEKLNDLLTRLISNHIQ